jgi:L-methionine (R)-S-oxide reductase
LGIATNCDMIGAVTQDRDSLLNGIQAIVDDIEYSKNVRAKQVANIIQSARNYHWVGIYQVRPEEIAAIGWTGANAPSHPTFPVTEGLNGAAVKTAQPVIANDVAADPRYLATFSDTQAEMIVPVLNAQRKVVGTIDIGSKEPNTFTNEDSELLQECATVMVELFS